MMFATCILLNFGESDFSWIWIMLMIPVEADVDLVDDKDGEQRQKNELHWRN